MGLEAGRSLRKEREWGDLKKSEEKYSGLGSDVGSAGARAAETEERQLARNEVKTPVESRSTPWEAEPSG